MKKSFYNTIDLKNKKLAEAIKNAKSQEEAIYLIFKSKPSKSFSPIEIHQIFKNKMLLTSVRRSISSLTSQNLLVKTDKSVDGIYGMPNYTWKLK